MDLKNGKVFTSKSVGTEPSSYEKGIYRAAVSQSLRNTGLERLYIFRPCFPNRSLWQNVEGQLLQRLNGQCHFQMTTKQMTTYAANYGLEEY